MPEINLSSALQQFGRSVFVDNNLDQLVLCLEAGHDNEDGWLYKSHFDSIEADDLFVYLRALLADRILRKSDIIFRLTKSLLGGDKAGSIDVALLRRVFVGTKQQTMNDDGINDVLQAFENPRQAVSALKEANKTHAKGWIIRSFFETRIEELVHVAWDQVHRLFVPPHCVFSFYLDSLLEILLRHFRQHDCTSLVGRHFHVI
jgi:hypothetical protein